MKATSDSQSKRKNVRQEGIATYKPVDVQDLKYAEQHIIKIVQNEVFRDEVQLLKDVKTKQQAIDQDTSKDKIKAMKRSGSLYKLDPFLDEDGLLQVGGWLSSVVCSHISKCVSCRRLRGGPQEQKMANLPKDSLEPAPPFAFSAVDYFGPWYIKEGRREGPVQQLRSDQGTNFVGARNELQQELAMLEHVKIRQELVKRNCDWVDFKTNMPDVSHMGGAWEHQIRTIQNVLTSLLTQQATQLDDEAQRTFMVEAEAIMNYRPLSVDTINSSQMPEPLMPNHSYLGWSLRWFCPQQANSSVPIFIQRKDGVGSSI